jgi:hypothetical protein
MPENNTDTEAIECFNKLIWQRQCEYSKKVLSYLKKLQFGNTCCEELEELKDYRRTLLIINCYDTRDIPENTTDYNTISYIEIKRLLDN